MAELLYEVDERGVRELVRSLESLQRVYLRFYNRTSRPVDVWWRNFQGHKIHYARLPPHTFYDVNSYITHPWEFTDVATNERYVINHKPIYRAPTDLGGMSYRTNWNITLSSVRTLRYSALLALAARICEPDSVDSLGLPRMLSEELKSLVIAFHRRQNQLARQ